MDPALVSYLKRLVTVLTAVMIIGVVTLVGLLVSRLQAVAPRAETGHASAPLALPDTLVLPDGARALAFTRGTDWYAVVTTDDRLLIFDAETGDLRQSIQIE